MLSSDRMTRLNDTIITRFPLSPKARQARREGRGRWEDFCEMKSLLCWNKSRQRRALNHSDTTTKRRRFPEDKSQWSHQTSYEEPGGLRPAEANCCSARLTVTVSPQRLELQWPETWINLTLVLTELSQHLLDGQTFISPNKFFRKMTWLFDMLVSFICNSLILQVLDWMI